MKRTWLPRFLAAILLALTLPVSAQSQSGSIVYEGFRNVRTNSNNSTYGQSLTHRYVGGELRFLTIAHPGQLHEFRIAGTALNGTVTATTATWDLASTGALNDFNGIWFEQAKNRLWITSAQDYTATNYPAKVTLVSLGSNGSISVIKQFFLNVPAKRVYGGCNAVPSSLVSQLGGPYVCGWGGYTSLVAQGGGASIGPTMYAIPDPDSIANGSTAQARTVLDHASTRGVRRTLPQNFFDGGDPRANPSTRPTGTPSSSGQWLSPNNEGLGWMTWGDSYYNTGVWIGTTYAAVMSGCKGACWYQSSTLAFDGRQFELHLWNGAGLGSNQVKRPDSMTELNLPRGNTSVWEGDTPTGNIAGATYDATSQRLYMIGFPFGADVYTGRLYSFTVGGGAAAAPSDSTDPTVSVTAPAAGATVSNTVTLSASASDNVGVAGVWFTIDGANVGAEDASAPYQASWNTKTVANGTHAVRAVARDASGNVTTSAVRNVIVNNSTSSSDNTAPTAALTAPANGSTRSGVVTVSASASDNVGIVSVQFSLNGVNLGAADSSAPYAINWNTQSAANGTYLLRATARDAAGNVATSATRSVTVNNATTPPSSPPPSNSGTGCLTPDPFVILGGGTCVGGGWLPPGISPPSSGPAQQSQAPPPPSAGICASVRPGADWTCYNGGWFPPGLAPAGSSSPSTPQAVSPPSAPSQNPATCMTVRPGANWGCYNGGWFPPGLIPAGLIPGSSAPQSPSNGPVNEPPPSTGCFSTRPGLNWVCIAGGWLPFDHPDAQTR